MKPSVALSTLITNPTFGVNILINAAIQKLNESAVVNYSLDPRKATIHLLRENPRFDGVEARSFIYLARTNGTANKAFFAKLEEHAFHLHGELQSDDLKAELEPLYNAAIQNRLGYGANPVLKTVKHLSKTEVQIQFESTVTPIAYDELGEEIAGTSKVRDHNARWTLLDPKVDFNNIIVIPRPFFQTAQQFFKLVAEIMEIDPERLVLDLGVIAPGVTHVDVQFNSSDLVYSGSVRVNIPPAGEQIGVYNIETGEPVSAGNPNENASFSAQLVFGEGAGDHPVQFANVGDIVNVVISATDLEIPQLVQLNFNGANVTATVDDNTVLVQPGEDLVVPVMIEAAVSNITSENLFTVLVSEVGQGGAVLAPTMAIQVNKTPVTVTDIAFGGSPTQLPAGANFVASVVLPDNYTLRSDIEWTTTHPAYVTLTPTGANTTSVVFSATIPVGTEVAISAKVDGVTEALPTITIIEA